MFCDQCGFENPDVNTYCFNDGALLRSKGEQITLDMAESLFCTACGFETSPRDLYCSRCGTAKMAARTEGFIDPTPDTTSDPTPKEADIKTYSEAVSKVSVKIDRDQVKNGLAGAAISIGILIVLSIIIAAFVTGSANRAVQEVFAYELGLPIGADFKWLSFGDVAALTNLVGLTLKLNLAGLIGGTATVDAGACLLLIVPFIALFLGGYISGKRNKQSSTSERLIHALITGLAYGVFVGLFSLFAGTSLSVPIYEGAFSLSLRYRFFQGVFNGFVLGFLFSLLGFLAEKGSLKSKAFLRGMPYNEAVYQGVFTAFKGLGLSFVAAMVFMIVYGYDLDLYSAGPLLFIAMGAQAAVYLWNLLTLNTFQISISEAYSRSILKANVITGRRDLAELIGRTSVPFYVYILALAALVLFIRAGSRLKGESKDGTLRSLAVFSMVYALFTAFVAGLANIRISASGLVVSEFGLFSNLTAGFGILATLITSFVVSFAFAYLGTLIGKRPH